jgi:hypothetical protein
MTRQEAWWSRKHLNSRKLLSGVTHRVRRAALDGKRRAPNFGLPAKVGTLNALRVANRCGSNKAGSRGGPFVNHETSHYLGAFFTGKVDRSPSVSVVPNSDPSTS